MHCVVTLVLSGVLAAASLAVAQSEPVNGIRPADLRTHAIVDATVVPAPGVRLEHATVVVRSGVIEAVGVGIPIPPEARRWPGTGLTVYAGLIEPAVLVEGGPVAESAARHWNPNVLAERRMADRPALTDALRSELRGLGITAAAVYPSDGILRGTGTVVCTADASDHQRTYEEDAAFAAGLDTRGWSSPSYPGSLMGAIALVRQTLLDAAWHAECMRVYERAADGNEPPAPAASLDALAPVARGDRPVLFDCSTEMNVLRAARLADEFGLDLHILGCGTEFRRLDEIAALGAPLLIPVNYAARPDVSTVARADDVSLRDLMTWEQSPTNLRRLHDAGATVAATTHRLRRRADFRGAMKKAIDHGLGADDALAMVTTTPAALLGLDAVMGTIEPGKVANLVVVEGDLFDAKAPIRATWVNGRRHVIKEAEPASIIMAGRLETPDTAIDVDLDTGRKHAAFTLAGEEKPVKAKQVTRMAERISIVVEGRVIGDAGWLRLSGAMTDGVIAGTGVTADGTRFPFTITPRDDAEVAAAPAPDADADDEAAEPDADVEADPVGQWVLSVSVGGEEQDLEAAMTITGDADALVAEVTSMGQTLPATVRSWNPEQGALQLALETPDGAALVEAVIAGHDITGSYAAGQGVEATFAGRRVGATGTGRGDDGPASNMAASPPPEELPVPFGAFGRYEPREAETVVFWNATLWTCGPQGTVRGSIVVREGRIDQVIVGDTPVIIDDGRMIDCTGKHITPGLIDCHSHTGISAGVNEGRQTNTAEVRIGDVINPDDVDWYRQLAGGLTAANQLHGSANPIGGQNSVVKIRWGGGADDFRVGDAIPGIKFALGENVKRSTSRYPNTRMGVETFIRDAFTAARAYAAAWERYDALPVAKRQRTMPPRRDLELDALVEILEGERIIHCHSYRQDEILALIRIADEFGFTIGTFQHVLEGYKVADAIADHGAGGSSFSDWWAYKVEVMDAIPHNGALMTDVGVLTSFNSDSDEVARRMNTEASKAVRYGGLAPEDALALVTINPARQLRIDHRTGSLERGKDADLVVWSGDPLSTYTRCEQTWIEGVRHFSIDEDLELRAQVRRERERLIQKALADAHGSAGGESATVSADRYDESLPPVSPEWQAWAEAEIRAGRDPFAARPGDCGCLELEFHEH